MENPTVAKVHKNLAFLFLALTLVMFYLAGLGAPGGEGFDAHQNLGRLLLLVALVLVVLAAIGRRPALVASAVLLVLTLLQSVLANIGDDVSFIAALHPVNGILLLFVVHQAARALPLPFVGGGGGRDPAPPSRTAA